MPVTTQGDALRAIRSQITALRAEDPQDPAAIRAAVRALREIRGDTDGDDVFDAFVECRDMESNPALFDEAEYRESATLLAQNYPSMPESPDPGNARLIDQQRTRGVWLRAVRNADSRLDPVRGWLAGLLERVTDTFVEERPIEAELGPAITALESGALDGSALSDALATLTQNKDRLRPPAQQ